MSTRNHKTHAPRSVRIAILSVSSTRTRAEDKSGNWIEKAVPRKHRVVRHEVVPDDEAAIRGWVERMLEEETPDVILTTGGTGIGPRDVTIEALRPLFAKELTAFGHLFATLSFEDIDAAALLSRATAGLISGALVFCMPGSLKACKLACKELIFPELGHLVKHVRED